VNQAELTCLMAPFSPKESSPTTSFRANFRTSNANWKNSAKKI